MIRSTTWWVRESNEPPPATGEVYHDFFGPLEWEGWSYSPGKLFVQGSFPWGASTEEVIIPNALRERILSVNSSASRAKQRGGRLIYRQYNPYSRLHADAFLLPLAHVTGFLPSCVLYRMPQSQPSRAEFGHCHLDHTYSEIGTTTPYAFRTRSGYLLRTRLCTLPNVADAVDGARGHAATRLIAGNIQTTMPLLRSTLELKDLPATAGEFFAFLRFAKRGRFLSISVREVARAYLWFKFGVQPTYQDVTRFLSSYRNLKVTFHCQPPNDGTAATRSVRWQVTVDPAPPVPPTWSIRPEAAYLGSRRRILNGYISSQGRPTFGARVTGTCFCRSSWRRINNKPLKTLVFNSPLASTAWELTPMSFVLDWFVNIGATLRDLEQRLIAAVENRTDGDVWYTMRTELLVRLAVPHYVWPEYVFPYGTQIGSYDDLSDRAWNNLVAGPDAPNLHDIEERFLSVPLRDERGILGAPSEVLRRDLFKVKVGLPSSGQALSLLALIASVK